MKQYILISAKSSGELEVLVNKQLKIFEFAFSVELGSFFISASGAYYQALVVEEYGIL